MLEELQGMAKTLDGLLSSVDPGLLHANDEARVLEAAAALEQRAASLKTLLAKRAAEAGQWANQGYRSPEEWLAKVLDAGAVRLLLTPALRPVFGCGDEG